MRRWTPRSAAASSAVGPIAIAAIEQGLPEARRIARDELAARFLPGPVRLLVRACAWRPLREWFVAASERSAPGVWGGILCRKRYADDKVAAALAAGAGQLVVLGAGLDTRACRLAVPAGAAAFEVDLPANVTAKRRVVERVYGRVPERLRLVPADLRAGGPGPALEAAGFRTGEPAVVLMEGVTPYLGEEGVRNVFAFLAGLAPGSRLLFTYLRRDFLDGTRSYGMGKRLRRRFVTRHGVWHFGLDPAEADALLAGHGWRGCEQVGEAEYRERYLRPAGRTMRVMPIELFAEAEKPRPGHAPAR
ncbi:SAM-dependent methyltransferase [Nonomuraea candida]|uniref:SAM-dependent methyltransferase n=1 Tax=Nonomuraea candida TaxID=359159 RepID=UPI0005BA707C|nr:SAM-dependent methyltransferase [Nonomuraea candida]